MGRDYVVPLPRELTSGFLPQIPLLPWMPRMSAGMGVAVQAAVGFGVLRMKVVMLVRGELP